MSIVCADDPARAVSAHPITSAGELLACIARWRDRFTVIAPPVALTGAFAPGLVLVPTIVPIALMVDAEGHGPEIFCDRGAMPDDARALGRIAVLKLASAAAVRWTARTRREDDGAVPFVWRHAAEGLIDLPDGGSLVVRGEAALDLRDGAPTVDGRGDRDLMRARWMGTRRAEALAKVRALRALGLREQYGAHELRHPFLVFATARRPTDRVSPFFSRQFRRICSHGWTMD